jgi:hypothetical protein
MRKRVKELREAYVNASPLQRYKVALERLQNQNSGPNLLIQHVSAVEGFARSVALDLAVQAGESRERAYDRLRNIGLVPLIREHIAEKINEDPEDLFGKDEWEVFDIAVQFRNLLVHEATFLRQGYTDELIRVCRTILIKLAIIAGIDAV